jgi:hypothetical protein
MLSKKKAPKTKSPPTSLKGWHQIATFLGQSVNVVDVPCSVGHHCERAHLQQ